ncbi:MAG: hypothetical protein QI197_03850 [Candidatus Korarchaeota archaeon]|nr:hypothetical protein [Candidatus Korarchaeota archaeon]
MNILFLEELSEDSVREVISLLIEGGIVITRTIDPKAVVSALESLLSRHEGESSGMEIEKLSEGGPYLIHPGGVKLSKRRGSVLISGVEPC